MNALLQVFSSPGTLFAGLNERKRAWIVPVIADAILVTLIAMAVTHFIGPANVARQQMSAFNLPADKMDAAIAAASSPARIVTGYVFTFVFVPVILLAIAGALLVFSMMTSRQPKFGAMYAMVSLSFFPYWLITLVMTVLVLMVTPDPASIDIRSVVATNVAAYMDKNTISKGMYSLLGSVDLLSFAEIGLLAWGFSKLTRAGIFGGLAAVLTLWVLYVSAKMALSALF